VFWTPECRHEQWNAGGSNVETKPDNVSSTLILVGVQVGAAFMAKERYPQTIRRKSQQTVACLAISMPMQGTSMAEDLQEVVLDSPKGAQT